MTQIVEQSSAPTGETGVRKLYVKDSDDNIYKINPDGTEEKVGGGGFIDSEGDGNTDTVPIEQSNIYVMGAAPSSPATDDIWIDLG